MSYESKDKMVSHPSHYQSGKYEVIDIIDEFTKDLSGTEAVCTANVIKYILRWKKKNGRQDVEKAIWYLQHLVDYLVDQETVKEPLDKEKKKKSCSNCNYENLDPNKFPCRTCYVTVHDDEPLGWDPKEEKKLEPGCDKCEISECKFLEDPIMNPPYNELWNQWKAQKETINNLLREKKEMQDSIDILENDKKILKEFNDDKELDEYIDKLQRSTAICINLDWIREYIKMNCPEGSEGRDYILAMLETWRVSMKEDAL